MRCHSINRDRRTHTARVLSPKSPVESAFAALKLGELNPMHMPTGKKSISNVAQMVEKKLAAIPRAVAIKYWHHAILGHFGYLGFERL